MQSNIKPVQVRDSAIAGKGVFATKNIRKGSRIIEYVGRIVRNEEADDISEKELENGNVYLFEIDDHFTIDGNVSYNDAKYINHSCSPNAESLNEDKRIWIIATKNIKEGEEITFDYCLDTDEPQDHPCRCGTQDCKGTLAAKAS